MKYENKKEDNDVLEKAVVYGNVYPLLLEGSHFHFLDQWQGWLPKGVLRKNYNDPSLVFLG